MDSQIASLSAADLLQAWETGQGAPPVWQALYLLAIVYPDQTLQSLSDLPIGVRDRRLMDLRRRLFGSRLESLVTCPQCGGRLELSFDLADIQAPELENQPESWELEHEGYVLRFRLPNSQDVLAAQKASGRSTLLERCLLEANCAGQPQPADQLPAPVQSMLIQRMAELDQQAEVLLPVDCPDCQHHWIAAFDITTFLWQELQNWAVRTLDEVNILARAYAWREADILALSPWRRRYYIQRVTG
jgi:hypothetical protein